MNIIEVISSFILLTLFMYAILLLVMGMLKIMNPIACEYKSNNKIRGRVSMYVAHFFFDPVNKNVSQTKLISYSLLLAAIITIAISIGN